jgi:hypothetical protein
LNSAYLDAPNRKTGPLQQLLDAYPYLWASLLSLVVLLLPPLLALPRRHRFSMVVVGLLNAGTSPFCALLEVSYWSPVRLGGWRLGIEDFIIGFVLGAAAWGVAIWPRRDRVEMRVELIPMLRRLLLTFLYLIPFICLHALGLSWMTSFLAAMVLVLTVQLAIRPSLWTLAAHCTIIFVPLYFLYLQLLLLVWPDFYLQWNTAPPWGLQLLGAPSGEIVWSVLFAMTLPVLAGYLMNVRLVPE